MSAFTNVRKWVARHRGRLKRWVTGLFVCFIIALLVKVGLTIEWGEVAQAMLETPRSSLWLAVPLVAASYVLYSCFDLLGRWYVGHDLPRWRTMLVAFISYAFTMNFSAAVGGLALRLRLYGKQGLSPGQIMRIMGLSITTNWMGYCLLAGGIFAAGAVRPPSDWEISTAPLRVIGVALMIVSIGYLALCTFSRKRSLTVRDHKLVLPQARIAVLQVVLAMMNWSVMGLVVYTVMPGEVGYATILGTLLIGSIVGAVAHIPGGLGVTEYVFITLVAPEVPRHQVLGAILVYRALYYLAPVLLAGVCYLIFETRSSAETSRGTEIA